MHVDRHVDSLSMIFENSRVCYSSVPWFCGSNNRYFAIKRLWPYTLQLVGKMTELVTDSTEEPCSGKRNPFIVDRNLNIFIYIPLTLLLF